MKAPARHRGSVYLATLGASMLVTILGVSALMTVRLQRQTTTLDRDAAQAAVYARSAVEVALRQVQNDANWRSGHTHDAWRSDIAHDRVRYTWKFASTAGNSLTGFPNDPVRVYGRATVGDAVRIESVLLRPIDLKGTTPGTNVLDNPSFTSNSDGWGLLGGLVNGLIELLTARTAPGALTVTGRGSPADGAYQNVTSKLVNGMTYETGVWGRSALLTSDNMRIRLVVQSTGSGTQTYTTAAAAINSLTWKQATGSFTPKWTGQLVDARWEVVTTGSSNNFTIDDAYLGITSDSVRPHTLDPASWRQELP